MRLSTASLGVPHVHSGKEYQPHSRVCGRQNVHKESCDCENLTIEDAFLAQSTMTQDYSATPVVLVIFNRPQATQSLIDHLRLVQPRRIYAIADGARQTHVGDKALVAQARKCLETIDWDCHIERIFSEPNLGCKARVTTGLNEVFSQEEKAIILEDDCLPDPSFFPFCSELLSICAANETIASIGGTSLFPFPNYRYSYRYSAYTHFWGWATWARAWQLYQNTEQIWRNCPEQRTLIGHMCRTDRSYDHWKQIFDSCINGSLSSWGYIWLLTSWIHRKLNIVPRVNLISNIGFGP